MAATATTWHARTALSQKSWLLTNGEVVTEPPLEETQSGRKVRIVGTTTSMFSKDVDALIFEGVKSIAASKGERVWMRQDEQSRRDALKSMFDKRLTAGIKPNLHLLTQRPGHNHAGGVTTVWWRFRHPSLPIEAHLVVEMTTNQHGYGVSATTMQDCKTMLVMQSTHPDDGEAVKVVALASPDMNELHRSLRSSTHRLRLSELLRDNKPNWNGEFTLNSQIINGDRAAVRHIQEVVRNIDGFEEIDVPDLRDPDKPAWLRLELQDTNLTAEFQQTLADYLDGSNVVAEVKRHYDEMVRLLRSTGLVLEAKDEASFTTALAGGDPVTIQVQTPPQQPGHTNDSTHSLVLHLPSGTMVVNCAAASASKDEIAHKWEEAVTMASLTGKEDELLAYARRYAETAGSRRAQAVLQERAGL